jgi:hypothetical protein
MATPIKIEFRIPVGAQRVEGQTFVGCIHFYDVFLWPKTAAGSIDLHMGYLIAGLPRKDTFIRSCPSDPMELYDIFSWCLREVYTMEIPEWRE